VPNPALTCNLTAGTANGTSYTYGAKPHAVTQVGGTSYAYDNNTAT